LNPASATLRIAGNAPSGPAFVGLTGTGTPIPVGTLSASPGSLNFGDLVIGTTSAAQVVTVTNTGTAAVTVSGIGASAGYGQTSNCATLQAGGSCTISVTFTPLAVGVSSGVLSVTSNAANALLTVNLNGSASPLPVPLIELSASSFAFANTFVGFNSAPQSLTLRNPGGAPLAIGAMPLSADYLLSNECPAQVAAGASCRISVIFRPRQKGARPGTLSVQSNAVNGTPAVELTGTGCWLDFRTLTVACQ
jgi:hypothetical protein